MASVKYGDIEFTMTNDIYNGETRLVTSTTVEGNFESYTHPRGTSWARAADEFRRIVDDWYDEAEADEYDDDDDW